MKIYVKLLGIFILVLVVGVMSATVKPGIRFVEEVRIEREVGDKWVGVISDTHVPARARGIPSKVFEVFKGVDLIIHAGDIVELDVLKDLESMAPVVAVHGNMDFDEVRTELPEMDSIEVLGKRIGIVHDAGIFGTEKMKRIAEENGFDILVFGHTHAQFFMEEDGKTFVNPGSATNPIPPFLVKASVALLRISKEGVEPIFVEL